MADVAKVGINSIKRSRMTLRLNQGGQIFVFTLIFSKENMMAQQQYESCIDACDACANACDFCAASCLQEQDVKTMARCIALDMDCGQLCRLAASYMARGSEFASTLCQTCAEVCDACADECSKYQMAHCQECAQACRRCADECRRMAGVGPGSHRGAGAGATAH